MIACELFAERGFDEVGVGDIAAAVGVGPSALYRHFAGKEEILAEAIGTMLDDFSAEITALAEPTDLLRVLPTFGLERRGAGALWARESRALSPAARESTRARIRAAQEALQDVVAAIRPELTRNEGAVVTAALLSVALSPSFHRLDLPRAEFEGLIAQMLERCLLMVLPRQAGEHGVTPAGLRRHGRREQILQTATALFADTGYRQVGMEEIGTESGVVASALYRHFSNKAELLALGVERLVGHFQIRLDQILAAAVSAEDALTQLVATYAELALSHPDALTVMITEHRSLTLEAEHLVHAQRDLLAEWADLLESARPDLRAHHAPLVVRAAAMTMNDVARTAELRSSEHAHLRMMHVATTVLGITPTPIDQ